MTNNNQYKGLIGLDLDGTLLDERKEISLENIQAIQEAIQKGYLVLPVTGRPLSAIPAELMQLQGMQYAIIANGAQIIRIDSYDQRQMQVMEECPISKERVLQILHCMDDFYVVCDCFANGFRNISAKGSRLFDTLELAPEIYQYMKKDQRVHENQKEFVRQTTSPILKVTLNFRNTAEGKNEKQRALLALSKLSEIVVTSGAVYNLEVNHPGAKKGLALMSLAELLSIDSKRIMACGDDGNDLDMIQRAPFGVAMGNASDAVKQAANYITAANTKNGVAQAINYFTGMEL